MADEMLVLPGERCRRAREEQGLTQVEAANRLHLSVSYLQALEADDYERLPEATFVKGYLRNYAKLLGLPSDEIANTFQQMVNEDRYDKALVAPVAPAREARWRKPVMIALLLLLAIVLLWWLLSRPNASAPDREPVTTPPAELSQSPQEAEPQPLAALEPVESVEPASDVAELADPAPLQAQTEPEPQAAPVVDDGIDRLVMRFSDNCWLRITDNQGRRLYEGEQAAGATLEVEGERPFSLVAGNAGAIRDVTLNGEVYTLPTSARGSVVRTRVQ